jgi:tyrosine aminotransferase
MSNGYLPSTGSGAARKAIAQVSNISDCPITDDDVVICSGCSGALELAITVLINEGTRTFQNLPSIDPFIPSLGDNILVPRPGFPLYQVITESLGGHVKHYALQVPFSVSPSLSAPD